MRKLQKVVSLFLCLTMLAASVVITAGASTYSISDGALMFDSDSALDYITKTRSLTVAFDSTERAMKLTVNSQSSDPDPYVTLDLSSLASPLNTDDFEYIAVTYKAPVSNSSIANISELFLCTGSVSTATAGKSVTYAISRGIKYITQIIPVANLNYWSGTINSLRFDCFAAASYGDTMYLDSVIMCRTLSDANRVKSDRESNTYSNDGSASGEDSLCTSYQISKYTSPVWKGNIVYNEAVFPVKDRNGNTEYTLMYTPDKVISVYNATFSALYTEGVDYTVNGNKITFLSTGKISTLDYEYIHPQSTPNNYDWSRYYKRTAAGDGKWEYWGQNSEFYARYINVTYTHSDTWNGYVPQNKAASLLNTSSAITDNTNFNVVFFGDSICGGANSSSYRNVYPYAEYWNQQIISELRKDYGCSNLNVTYSAVGGSTATGMLENLSSGVISHAPDLVFIEFGMNDAMNESQDSSGSLTHLKSSYKSAVEQMISGVRASYPNCEFVLVAPFYGNIYCHYRTYFEACRDALNEIESANDGVAVVDVTSMHSYLLTFKDYLDFSGDNMCHPNDFMSRIYAQMCLEAIVPGGVSAYVPQSSGVDNSNMNYSKCAPSGHGWYWADDQAYCLINNYGTNGQDIELSVDLCLLPSNSGELSSAKLWTSDGSGMTITPNYVTVGGQSVSYEWGAPGYNNWHRVTFKIKNGAASITIDDTIIASASSGVIAYTGYQMLFSQTGSMAIDNISMTSGDGTQYFDCDFENTTQAQNLFSGGLGMLVTLVANTVKYDCNKGSGDFANQIKVSDVTLTLTNDEPSREGYDFLGWSANPQASEAEYQPGDTYIQNSSVTLYAVWSSTTNDKPPVISSVTPSSAQVTDTGSQTYTVTAEGTGTLTYSWVCVSSSGQAIVSGANTKSLTVSVNSQKKTGFTAIYKCVVTDSNGLSNESNNVSFVYNTTYTVPEYTLGDVNNDGYINAKDSNILAQINSGSIGIDNASAQFLAADVNRDGYVNAKDSNLVISYNSGLITEF